jgi:hypothetical protein
MFLQQSGRHPREGEGFGYPPETLERRAHVWWPGLGRYRRHRKDYEQNTASSEAMIDISMIHVMLRRLERGKT